MLRKIDRKSTQVRNHGRNVAVKHIAPTRVVVVIDRKLETPEDVEPEHERQGVVTRANDEHAPVEGATLPVCA